MGDARGDAPLHLEHMRLARRPLVGQNTSVLHERDGPFKARRVECVSPGICTLCHSYVTVTLSSMYLWVF